MGNQPADPTSDATVAGALEDSAEDLYDNAPCGYLSALEDGTIVKVNATFLRWTGYRADDLVGRRRFQELLSPGGQIYHETHYAPLLRMQGSVREIAVEIVRADGTRLPALVNSVLRESDGARPGVIRTTVFDATERRRYEHELLAERRRAQESEARARFLAETLQASIIPPEPSHIPGFDIAAVYRPAGSGDTVGGDFFDVFETRRGDWIVVVGDVSGKGVEAARVTAAARYTLRAAATRSSDPAVVLSELNDALIEQDLGRYCTVVCARVAKTDREVTLTVASAGHPLPLRLTPTGSIDPVGHPGTIVGAFERVALSSSSVELVDGDTIVLYTDGVTEGRRGDDFYGEGRLCEVIMHYGSASAARLAHAIVDDVLSFQGNIPRDDIAVLILRYAPGS